MASVPPTQPDPRTAADDGADDATPAPGPGRPGKGGVSATDPAEGSDDEPGEQPGSPHG